MSEQIEQIARRIRELREVEGYSAEQFATLLGIESEVYAQYESGRLDMPVSFLYEVSHRLKVDMATLLTGVQPRLSRFSLVRKGEGLDLEGSKQYKYKSLASKFHDKIAEPLLVTVFPQGEDEPIHVNSHPGQEIDYLLEGSVVISIDGKEITLYEGDTLYYDAKYPHGMKAVGDSPAKLFVVIMQQDEQ